MKRIAPLLPGIALGLWLLLGALGLRATLDPATRAAVDAALSRLDGDDWLLVAAWWLAGAALAAWLVVRLRASWARVAARMADATRAIAGTGQAPDLAEEGAAPLRALAAAVNALAARRRDLAADRAEQVEAASARVAQQRDQLAALMAQLQHSVLVCNREGRILLYNERALRLSRALSQAPGGQRGGELVGLGRSVHALVDAGSIRHGLEIAGQRQVRGGDGPASVRFVTATAGRLLRVDLAPVHAEAEAGAPLSGYILLLDDITREQQSQGRRDGMLRELTEASRASFAAIQAALDMLDYPDLDAAERERFQAVLRQEVAQMALRLDRLAGEASADQRVRWPLQRMRGSELLGAAARRIEAGTGQPIATEVDDDGLWLRVDSLGLIQALAFLAARLRDTPGPTALRLQLARAGSRAHLDLAWQGASPPLESLRAWQTDAMEPGGTLGVRDVVERHGGELWLERDPGGAWTGYRFLLPVARAGSAVDASGSRPEYYDFDLFAASADSHDLDGRPLAELAYTAFDTETTGLDPAGGDAIIQLGAVRIVNGRLLASETFEQLVDPQRGIPEEGMRYHGITRDMVRGQPTIDEVLPAFHAFVGDTVLVGHNVAFDMRFLALREDSSGVRFRQPVLDTLLLASLVWPNEPGHGLDDIAARLGVEVAGRHTALGDARATAEVFLRLLPLLRGRGIETLGQARVASESSWYAGLRY